MGRKTLSTCRNRNVKGVGKSLIPAEKGRCLRHVGPGAQSTGPITNGPPLIRWAPSNSCSLSVGGFCGKTFRNVVNKLHAVQRL